MAPEVTASAALLHWQTSGIVQDVDVFRFVSGIAYLIRSWRMAVRARNLIAEVTLCPVPANRTRHVARL